MCKKGQREVEGIGPKRKDKSGSWKENNKSIIVWGGKKWMGQQDKCLQIKSVALKLYKILIC